MFDPSVLPQIQAARNDFLALIPYLPAAERELAEVQVRALEANIDFIERCGQ